MPKDKEKTFTETLLEFALENKKEHQQYMAKLSAETLSAVIGRKAKLIVAGEGGGQFIIKVTPYGVFSDDSTEDIRNVIWMDFGTFQDIVIGELDPKVARARDQIQFTGDRSLYDSHEIIRIVGEWMSTKVKPIAQRMVRAMVRESQ